MSEEEEEPFMKFSLPGLLIVAMIGGMFSSWQKKEEPDADEQVLDQLKKGGPICLNHITSISTCTSRHNTLPIWLPKMSNARWMT